jgi:hypothetical protein
MPYFEKTKRLLVFFIFQKLFYTFCIFFTTLFFGKTEFLLLFLLLLLIQSLKKKKRENTYIILRVDFTCILLILDIYLTPWPTISHIPQLVSTVNMLQDLKDLIMSFLQTCQVCHTTYLKNQFECEDSNPECCWHRTCDHCRELFVTHEGVMCTKHGEEWYQHEFE